MYQTEKFSTDSEESMCLKLLILHLWKTVYINQGHPEPGPPRKCLNKHSHFQAIEKVKAVSLFNFYVIFHSIQLKRTSKHQCSVLQLCDREIGHNDPKTKIYFPHTEIFSWLIQGFMTKNGCFRL